MVELSGFVAALRTDEHKYFMIDRVLLEQGQENIDKPFPKIVLEALLISFDTDGVGQFSNIVGYTVPWLQVEQKFLERIELKHVFGVQHIINIVQTDTADFFVHTAPQSVDISVGERGICRLAGKVVKGFATSHCRVMIFCRKRACETRNFSISATLAYPSSSDEAEPFPVSGRVLCSSVWR